MTGKKVFDRHVIEFACPGCGKEHGKTVAWLKDNPDFTCACGRRLETEKLGDIFKRADKAVTQFGRSIGKIAKRLR